MTDLLLPEITLHQYCSTMAVKRGTALKSKSSITFIWYLLAWFTFRTLPILYFKINEQKKWGSKVRTAGSI
jgi:hypothetical protein